MGEQKIFLMKLLYNVLLDHTCELGTNISVMFSIFFFYNILCQM